MQNIRFPQTTNKSYLKSSYAVQMSFHIIDDNMNNQYSTLVESLLTLNVRGPSHQSLSGSISWLLIPWHLTSLLQEVF